MVSFRKSKKKLNRENKQIDCHFFDDPGTIFYKPAFQLIGSKGAPTPSPFPIKRVTETQRHLERLIHTRCVWAIQQTYLVRQGRPTQTQISKIATGLVFVPRHSSQTRPHDKHQLNQTHVHFSRNTLLHFQQRGALIMKQLSLLAKANTEILCVQKQVISEDLLNNDKQHDQHHRTSFCVFWAESIKNIAEP